MVLYTGLMVYNSYAVRVVCLPVVDRGGVCAGGGPLGGVCPWQTVVGGTRGKP